MPKLTPLLALGLCLLVGASARCEDAPTVVTLRAQATVSGPEVLLGEVAEIQAAPELAKALGEVSLSSSPLPGASRAIAAGYVSLRLRRFGYGPSQVEVKGGSVTVSRSGSLSTVPSPAMTTSGDMSASPAPMLVHRGQVVEVEADCGAVTIRTTATAGRDGVAGEIVDLRLLDGSKRLSGRVVGPGRVLLIITENPS